MKWMSGSAKRQGDRALSDRVEVPEGRRVEVPVRHAVVGADPPRGRSDCHPSEGRTEKIEHMDCRYIGSIFRGPSLG
jgi:hypothetical protein